MTQISLGKAYAIIDEERGKLLKERKKYKTNNFYSDDADKYEELSNRLRLLNKLKRQFALVSDSDQIPLGL